MQIHGGYGYSSEFPLERMLRDVRALLAEEVPAVMVTGDAGSAHMRLAQESGLTVMVKPVRPVQLRAFLGQVFASNHAQPAA